ncbi:ATP-binding protein [Streptomyces sp. NBC_00424]|uniref:ATP-binding protein n=1 Tax=Streptomyces sp. NBC_00424 TaxID=2903648 RepID=UPI00225ABCCE|nr:ATP-binding protein [Streptomyces sp. NBC_00424]MCX5078926.1 ATP-binding protein [Streptomyces sp. NBC_00424]
MSYRVTAPHAATTPRIIRDWLALLLATLGHAEIADRARLCASEAVTNAYQHTRTDRITVEVTIGPTVVTVSVNDDSPGWIPHAGPEPSARDERGRGLALIRAHAIDLRVVPHPTGKAVQFTLPYGETP